MTRFAASKLRPLAVLVLGAGIALALTAAATPAPPEPVTIDPLIPEFLFSSSFSPTALSATVPTPIKLKLSAEFHSPEGGGAQPPALRELLIRTDRQMAIDTKGLPVCNSGIQIQAARPGGLPERCKSALIGHGSAVISIADPDVAGKALRPSPKVLIYNGGTRGSTTTLIAYAPITLPTPGAIIAKIKIKKISEGAFGGQARVMIPKIAGGSGAIVSFDAIIGREYTYKRQRKSVLTLRCPSGKTFIAAKATFVDTSIGEVEDMRNCTRR